MYVVPFSVFCKLAFESSIVHVTPSPFIVTPITLPPTFISIVNFIPAFIDSAFVISPLHYLQLLSNRRNHNPLPLSQALSSHQRPTRAHNTTSTIRLCARNENEICLYLSFCRLRPRRHPRSDVSYLVSCVFVQPRGPYLLYFSFISYTLSLYIPILYPYTLP